MSRGPSDNHASKAKHSAEHVAKTRTTVTVPAKALHYLRILCAVEGRQLQWGSRSP